MGSSSTLIWGIVFGSVGAGYLIYGKKRQRLGAFLAGLGLCVYPMFVESVWATVLIGVALILVPFFYRD